MPFNFLHPFGFICRFLPLRLSKTSCLYAVAISEFLLRPCALSNFLHAFGFNISASPVSQQLPALIWFQYLISPLCLSSNFFNFLHSLGFNVYTLQGVQRPSPCDTLGFPPPSHSALFFPTSTLHTSVPHLGAFTWLQYLNFPPLCLSPISCIHSLGLKTSPLAS